MAKMFLQSFPPVLERVIFQLYPQVISAMNVKDGVVSMIMVMVCLALVAIMKDQVEQLNKIGAAAMTLGVDEEAAKNGNYQFVCKMG